MTRLQIIGAINQMLVSCELKMVNYESVSARGLLYELGFEADADEIIEFIADGGFYYCLDPSIPSTHFTAPNPEYPDPDVCYWGPDQLASRLRCLSNVPYNMLARER